MTSDTRAACIVGWPVGHSRSPLIHNYWRKHYGIAGAYRREAVPPDEFAAFVRNLAARGYAGCNVTLPHKEAALKLSQPDDRAEAVGLVGSDASNDEHRGHRAEPGSAGQGVRTAARPAHRHAALSP